MQRRRVDRQIECVTREHRRAAPAWTARRPAEAEFTSARGFSERFGAGSHGAANYSCTHGRQLW